MSNIDPETLLTDAQLLTLPWYAHGRKPGKAAAKTTIFRHRQVGRLTPTGERRYLRGIRVASGSFVYRYADVVAFWNDLNGEGAPTPFVTPSATIINTLDAAEAEMVAAGFTPAA